MDRDFQDANGGKMATARHSESNSTEQDELLPPIHDASAEEWWDIFDSLALNRLGMSGTEFIRRWDAGDIEDPDRTDVMMLVLMIPPAHEQFGS